MLTHTLHGMLLFFSLLNAHTHTSWNASLWLLRTEHCCLHRVLDLHAETSVFLPVGIKNKILLHEECYVCQFDESFSRLSRLGWGLDIPIRETCSSLWGMSSLLVTLSPPSACLVWNQHLLSKKTRDGPCWWPRRYSHSCQGRHAKKKRLLLGLGVGG